MHSIEAMADGVLLLTGPPGSGKTTTARLIATTIPLGAHIETDSFFHFVRGGYTTVVDGIISPKWFLEPLSEALVARGHAVSYAILRPTLATCLARASARAGSALGNPDVIGKLWNDFADVDGLERHVVEVGEDEPESLAHVVISRWRAGALRIER